MAASPKPPSRDALALGAFVKLMRAANSVSARVHRHLAAERLSESQFGVLEALHHRGPLCQRDLAEKILKTGGNLTMVVDNLEKRGLVRRDRDRQDRRLVNVALTAAGSALIRRVYPQQAAAIAAEMKHLTPAEQETLARLCRKLGLRGGGDDSGG